MSRIRSESWRLCGRGTTASAFEERKSGSFPRICRTQLGCCAEHAHECSILLEFSGKAPAFRVLSWVKLLGTVSYRQEGGKTVPVITIKEIKETPKPVNALLR